MNPRPNFEEINQAALLSLPAIVSRYVPDVKASGNWLVGCSPVREDRHPSFGVNKRSGAFKDFATGDWGSDQSRSSPMSKASAKVKQPADWRANLVSQAMARRLA